MQQRNRIAALLAGWVLLVTTTVAAQETLAVGDKAPEFPNPLPSSAGENPGETKIALADV
jgi:hypothetical protein